MITGCEDRNSEFVQDLNTCPGGTCDSPDFEECGSPPMPFGCQCKEGYVKISEEDSTCVLVEECYNHWDVNEIVLHTNISYVHL